MGKRKKKLLSRAKRCKYRLCRKWAGYYKTHKLIVVPVVQMSDTGGFDFSVGEEHEKVFLVEESLFMDPVAGDSKVIVDTAIPESVFLPEFNRYSDEVSVYRCGYPCTKSRFEPDYWTRSIYLRERVRKINGSYKYGFDKVKQYFCKSCGELVYQTLLI